MPSSTSTCGRIAWPSGYKNETRYSLKSLVTPTHGDGPRCEVDYNSNDDGPWTTLRIKDVTRDNVEDYTTAMPRYYAIPLILINKMLAYVESQCRPDGTPLPGNHCKVRDLRDYSYLWRLRENFLKAIFAMNHDIRLDEQWRWEGIQGFLHRMYRRFGHNPGERLRYSREEMAAGRRPYCIPDLAKMGEFAGVPYVFTSLQVPHFPPSLYFFRSITMNSPAVAGWRGTFTSLLCPPTATDNLSLLIYSHITLSFCFFY